MTIASSGSPSGARVDGINPQIVRVGQSLRQRTGQHHHAAVRVVLEFQARSSWRLDDDMYGVLVVEGRQLEQVGHRITSSPARMQRACAGIFSLIHMTIS